MSVYRPRRSDGSYRSEFWLYDFLLTLPSGERRRFHGSTGQRKEAAARKVEDHLRELAKTGRLNVLLTLNDAAWRYQREVADHQPSGVDTAKSLEHLCRLAGPELPLVALDAERIADAARRRAGEFVEHRRRKGPPARTRLVSAASVNRQIVEMARRLLRRARRVWGVPVNIDLPWSDLRLPEANERVRVISSAEDRILAAQTREDYAPIMRVYRITGARKAALCGLRKDAVDWDRDGFTIVLKRKRGELPRPHFIPFSDELRAIFRAEMRASPTPFVFTYQVQRGPKKGMRRPITYNGLRGAWDRARKGIADLRFHDQRHDAATDVLRKTGNLMVAGRLLGHADLSSTQRYAHVLDDDLRAAVASRSRTIPEALKAAPEEEAKKA